ncbi:MAG: ATP-binding protein [Deltaproteobacteria bacterium]
MNLKRASIRGRDCVLAVVRSIAERKRAYAELNKAHAELEKRVQERTAELVTVNEDLKREIAERKRVEEWLRDSERRYRSLVDEVPDIIFILDREGRFTYVNTQIEALLGCAVKDILETPLGNYVAADDRHKIDELKAMTVDSIWDEEVGLVDVKGTLKFARIRCKAALEAESNLLRFEGVMRDITRRRVLEEQLRASREQLLEKIRIIDDLYAHIVESGKARAITDHTAEVAHELRQPLAIIGGFVRRLVRHLESSEGGINEGRKEIFKIIISEIQRLERILDNLIDFTKRDLLSLERTDPNDVIIRVLSVYEGMLRNKDLNIEASLGEEVGDLLLDPDRFERVIRNLLSNAIEASDRGGTIRIETGVSIPSGKAHDTGELDSENYFEVKIRNRGAVIAPSDLQRVFTPFYTTKRHGTGTGLPLTKKIVEDHGGSISVHSDEEETVFTVWLPIKTQELALTDSHASEQS